MSATHVRKGGPTWSRRARQNVRVLQVIAGAEFKLKYADSVLGYAWSVIKPLSLFTVMYLVFGRLFGLNKNSPYYGLSLLMGVVLFGFFSDSTSLGMTSLVARQTLLQKLRFPRIVIPVAATVTAALTFLVNAVVVAGFVAWKGIPPQLNWILVIPLLLELYVFIVGIALVLATLLVPLRDITQVWELALQILFYATPVIYPVGYLPAFARNLAFVNPLTQVLQDIRALVLYPDLSGNKITATDALGSFGRLIPIAVALGTFAFGVWLFQRKGPRFAERL